MKYAKSITLGGQLINASNTRFDSYKDLLCRCPICGSPVFLAERYKRSRKNEGCVQGKKEWRHYQEVDYLTVKECEVKANYTKQQVTNLNCEAKDKRYEIYETKMWDIIKTSHLVNWESHSYSHEMLWAEDTFRWYGEKLLKRFRADRGEQLFDLALEYVIEQNEGKTPWFEGNSIDTPIEELIASNVSDIYSREIVREVFMYLWFHGTEEDIKKIITFGLDQATAQEILAVGATAISALNDVTGEVQIGSSVFKPSELSNYQALNCAEVMAFQLPNFKTVWEEKMSKIEAWFFFQLCINLLTVPWIDELKKINQQQLIGQGLYGGN